MCDATLCIGVDVTWWGGSPRDKSTQAETIISGLVFPDGTIEKLEIKTVDLSSARNKESKQDMTQPNFDAEGTLLVQSIGDIISKPEYRGLKCVLALDAPLESEDRPDQRPRRRCVPKGKKTGWKRRECEVHLSNYASGKGTSWRQDLRIQSGSPIIPRIKKILCWLKNESGFAIFGESREYSNRQVIEIFPSEAIWALGISGYYGNSNSRDIRAYKKKKPTSRDIQDAEKVAKLPLSGFNRVVQDVEQHVDKIWRHIKEKNFMTKGTVRTGKGFDDPLDSGIAFFTAACFIIEKHHVWGDGHDGTIIGPITENELSGK